MKTEPQSNANKAHNAIWAFSMIVGYSTQKQ